jgi:hypothetical protein
MVLTSQRIAGGVLVVFGSVLVAQAASIDRVIQTGLSPAAFPNALALAIIALGVAIAAMPPIQAETPQGLPVKNRFGFVGVLVYGLGGAFTLFVLDSIGFIIVATVLIVTIGWRLGAKPVWLGVTAVIAPVLAQVLFEFGFGVPLSHGILGGVLG